jgi:hypothetical protein
VHPRKQEVTVKPVDPAVPIPEDAQRLLFRARVVAVAAFALAVAAASWIGNGRPTHAAPPSMLARVP